MDKTMIRVFLLLSVFNACLCEGTYQNISISGNGFRKVWANFDQIPGFRLEAYQSTVNTSDSFVCSLECLKKSDCLSFNFNKVAKRCELSNIHAFSGDSRVIQHQDYIVFTTQIPGADGHWQVAFRTSIEKVTDPLDAWKTGSNSSSNKICKLMVKSGCQSYFREPKIDQWETLGITEVKLDLYRNGSRVASVRFNGTGTNMTSWLRRENLIGSGWSSLTKHQTFGFFSMEGFRTETQSGTFLITQQCATCEHNEPQGWMMVRNTCPQERTSNTCQQFLYANGNEPAKLISNGDNVGEAEILAIFIKYKIR